MSLSWSYNQIIIESKMVKNKWSLIRFKHKKKQATWPAFKLSISENIKLNF